MKHLIKLGTQFIGYRDAAEDMRGNTFVLYSPLSSANLLLFVTTNFHLSTFFLENLDRTEKHAEELAAKLERSEKARKKAEQEAATVEDLRQRLHKAENALSDKVSQQIACESAIIARLETQNRRFVSKFLLHLPSFLWDWFSAYFDELEFCSSRKNG